MAELKCKKMLFKADNTMVDSNSKTGINKRFLVEYKNLQLLLTFRQMEMISLIAKGFSNSKIAKKTKVRESAVKLMIYRLIKYLDKLLEDKIDRFYLIVLSQEILNYFEENYPEIKLFPGS